MRVLTGAMLMVLSLSAGGISTVSAEEEAPPVNCSNPMSTYEINVCSEKEFEKADADLNAAYRQALAAVAASDSAKPYDRKSWEEALRTSQRAWVAFRDAECKGLIPMEWQGGTGTTGAELGCMTQLTSARTKELRERYAEK